MGEALSGELFCMGTGLVNPPALRMAKTLSFRHSDCNRVNGYSFRGNNSIQCHLCLIFQRYSCCKEKTLQEWEQILSSMKEQVLSVNKDPI